MSELKIDAYCHLASVEHIEFLEQHGSKNPWADLLRSKPHMIDAKRRLEWMDEHGVDISVFVPTPWNESSPPVAQNPQLDQEAARICNDGLAPSIDHDRKRLFGVAELPTATTDIMLAEFERALDELGFVGAYLPVGPTVKRMDDPAIRPLFALAAERDVPIWLHPSRPKTYADYVDESESKFVDWQTLGWLHDTSTAMTRIVFAGLFEEFPSLKIITHHHGAFVPLFANRMQMGFNSFSASGEDFGDKVQQPYIEHFRKFYCDTATFGYEPLLLQQAHSFFGPDRMLFGTDTPFDLNSGDFLRNAQRSVEALPVPEGDKTKIYSGNAQKVIRGLSAA